MFYAKGKKLEVIGDVALVGDVVVARTPEGWVEFFKDECKQFVEPDFSLPTIWGETDVVGVRRIASTEAAEVWRHPKRIQMTPARLEQIIRA